MKKTLLSLACAALLSVPAFAQTTNPLWVQQTIGSAVPANQLTTDIVTVNAATVWVLFRENVANSVARTFARTTDGGTTWTGGAINLSTGGTLPANLGIGNITAIDANNAWISVYPATAATAGSTAVGIYRTTNGGTSWTKQTTATFTGGAAFPNGVHFFDANVGVAFGDPNPVGANVPFEIYNTTNGGTTWTRNTNAPVSRNAEEYGLAGVYYALGNTIWFGGYSENSSGARLFKSTNQGLTWTAASTDIADGISEIAFSDQQNGLIAGGFDLLRTTNGGTTNTLIAPTGNFRPFGMDAVPGLANTYVSVGVAVPQNPVLADYGSSISRNGGLTWTDLQTSIIQYEVDMLSATVGYTGGYTGPSTGASTGGIYKLNRSVTANRASAALQNSVEVHPNPSNDGVFMLNVAAGSTALRSVTINDALGREVYNTTLRANGALTNMPIDLSKHKAGMYTLKLDTDQGVVVKKLVIQ